MLKGYQFYFLIPSRSTMRRQNVWEFGAYVSRWWPSWLSAAAELTLLNLFYAVWAEVSAKCFLKRTEERSKSHIKWIMSCAIRIWAPEPVLVLMSNFMCVTQTESLLCSWSRLIVRLPAYATTVWINLVSTSGCRGGKVNGKLGNRINYLWLLLLWLTFLRPSVRGTHP